MIYTIYKQHHELLIIKQQLIHLSKRVLQLELLKTETETFNDISSNNNTKTNSNTNTNTNSEMSVSVLTIDTALANSTCNIDTLETNTSTNNDIKEDTEIKEEYEYIEHNNDTKILNKDVNRKKSNSITDAIWAGITDNIIYF